jgi:hypothetical protein
MRSNNVGAAVTAAAVSPVVKAVSQSLGPVAGVSTSHPFSQLLFSEIAHTASSLLLFTLDSVIVAGDTPLDNVAFAVSSC